MRKLEARSREYRSRESGWPAMDPHFCQPPAVNSTVHLDVAVGRRLKTASDEPMARPNSVFGSCSVMASFPLLPSTATTAAAAATRQCHSCTAGEIAAASACLVLSLS